MSEILERIQEAERYDATLPAFPVTRAYPLRVPGFSNVWLKDESTNVTGTHKDRMAWEIVMIYKDMLLTNPERTLPHMSIISSGSAALAIQTQMRKFHLPNLKILVDDQANPKTLQALEKIGCEVYRTNLEGRLLDSQDILRLTKNENGFDLTATRFDPAFQSYDWLSMEVFNLDPQYVFTPFGTGHLFENLLHVARNLTTGHTDPLYHGDPPLLRHCNFIGATTSDPLSKAVKLYAPFRPFSVGTKHARLYAARGYCGAESGIHEFSERYLDDAIALAAEHHVVAEPSALAGLALLLEKGASADAKIVVISTGKTKLLE
jgi:threonine dehydratase